MTEVEKLIETYDVGFKTFEQLFNLNDTDLKLKLDSICGEKLAKLNEYLVDKVSTVRRTIVDMIPEKISIYHYDVLEITAYGITMKPEHGEVQTIKNFDKHFKL